MAKMTSFYVGVSGLQASQNAINTTAHNLSNVNTTGYVRQQAILGDRDYSLVGRKATSYMQVGLGVDSIATSRIRDILLDSAYRSENSRGGFYEAQYEAITEIETIVGETEGEQYQNIIEKLWSAINEMSKTPDSLVARSELVMYAEEFLNRSQNIYDTLIAYQDNLDTKITELVNEVNSYGAKLNELNKLISSVEAVGVEAANDLRDERDVVLDELSKLVKMSYTEIDNGIVTVKIEGVDFVSETSVFPMETAELDGDRGSTYLSCVWPHLEGREVFFLEEEISTANNNDKGELKGYLLARGDYVADYTDIPQTKDYDLTTEEGRNQYYDAVDIYHREVSPSSVMSMQAMLDTLVNGIVTSINDVMAPKAEERVSFVGADGTVYDNVEVLDINCSVGADGELPPAELFSRLYTDRFVEVLADDGTTYYVYNDLNTFGTESLYSIKNMEINQEVISDYSKLPFTTREGEIDLEMGLKMVEAWGEPFASLNPDNLTKKTFKQYYNEAIYNIGNRGTLNQAIAENQVIATSQINAKRNEIMGVSSDEELTNLIKFQNAYNASSRYINVISEMLEHIIMRLGS
ncbi:MAG: flagellar hook-associated protein FlgK [Lachnospiraceae bacterium]|nr:flagellar hook-associated protein FlgK [Lachnospiraceae bacterium]MBQ4068822.1 flagellar hook-associated protein FlgK [Lachnospiraceae bacterium]